MQFEFATASRIVFGPGTVKELPAAAKSFGGRALLVQGKSSRGKAIWSEQPSADQVEVSEFHVTGEPTVETVIAGIDQARSGRCEVVIAIGGGSIIDTAKAVSALLANPGTIHDYLEVVGKGQALLNPSMPCIAVPTTAGTGSEVTRNAVLAVTEWKVKVSLRGAPLLPRLAIVDPELTYTLPPDVTAASGLDALTQLIEPFLSTASNPMTDAVCREGIRRISRSLRAAYEHGDDRSRREDMSLGSLFSGMALANARLGAVHGFAGPIGGMYPAAHGAICARLLPVTMEVNVKALRSRASQSPALQRLDEVGQLLTGDEKADADEGVRWLRELCAALKIPALVSYGIEHNDIPEIVAQAKKARSMQGNPIELTDSELTQIMELAL